MSEIVHWQELDSKSLFSWYMVEAMIKTGRDIFKDFDPKNGVEVTMTMNGVEVPFMEIFAEADNQVEAMIKAEAAEMVNAMASDITNKMIDISNKLYDIDSDVDGLFKEDS
jgi:hypothetical protein